MRLVLRILGADIFEVSTNPDAPDVDGRGDLGSTPISFTDTHGDYGHEADE